MGKCYVGNDMKGGGRSLFQGTFPIFESRDWEKYEKHSSG